MGWAYSTYGERSACRVLLGKPEAKRNLGRSRHGSGSFRSGLEAGTGLIAQDRDKWRALVNVVMKLWVP